MPSIRRFHIGKEQQNLSSCVSRDRPVDPESPDNRVPGNLFVSQNCFDSGQDFVCGGSRLPRQHRSVFVSEIVERVDQIVPRLQDPRVQFWSAASGTALDKGNDNFLTSKQKGSGGRSDTFAGKEQLRGSETAIMARYQGVQCKGCGQFHLDRNSRSEFTNPFGPRSLSVLP